MTAQNGHATTFQATRIGAPRRGRDAATTALFAAALMGCVVPAVGCKTGTSFTKPSWWTLGGTPKADADTLASAPPYGGDIKKPSESAKQYPTTSTPSGYVITGTAGPTDAVAQQFQAAQQQAPVVYGTTPPALPAATAVAAATSSAIPQQPAPTSIAPQVGPYAAHAGDSIPPPGQPLPPISPSTTSSNPGTPSMAGAGMASMPSMTATPAEAALPNTGYSNFSTPTASPVATASPAPRMADARAADPAAAIPAAALPVEQPAYGGSRYPTSTGSRFGSAEAASFSPAAGFPPASSAAPTEAGFPPPATATPLGAPATVSPPASPASSAAPGLLQPSAQPVRRPDPGYRPGGTSSYRTSRTILADDSAPAAVRTASYEEPAGTIQR